MCDDMFSSVSAWAICRFLGFDRGDWSSGLKWDIQERYDITLDDVRCVRPNWPMNCTFSNETVRYCVHVEDVFLSCRNGKIN